MLHSDFNDPEYMCFNGVDDYVLEMSANVGISLMVPFHGGCLCTPGMQDDVRCGFDLALLPLLRSICRMGFAYLSQWTCILRSKYDRANEDPGPSNAGGSVRIVFIFSYEYLDQDNHYG